MARLVAYSVIVLATIGFYIAAYFTLVYYGRLVPDTRFMPSVCRLEERTCQTVLNTRSARVFGVPNSLLGALYYAAVIVIISGGRAGGVIGAAVVIVSWITVALGCYLIYALFFIIRIPCPLCLAGHTINLLLALLLTFYAR